MSGWHGHNRLVGILGVLVIGVLSALAGCDRGAPKPADETGTGVWVCPMDPDVVLQSNVPCPKCGMALKRAHGEGAFVCAVHVDDGSIDIEPGNCRTCEKPRMRVGTTRVYICPQHPSVELDKAGDCPVCETELKPERRAIFFRCPKHPDPVAAQAGACRVCATSLERMVRALPHGDHNPKHGGEFFMAADRWHHLEGTVPEPGLFRLYIYDNFTRPMISHEVSGFVRRGRETDDGDIVLDERELALAPVPNQNYMEVRIPEFTLPLELVAFLKFADSKDSKEERFDFSFVELSRSAPAADGAPERVKFVVPGTLPEVLVALVERVKEVESLVRGRDLDELYRPALEAKDLVLALEKYAESLTVGERQRFERASVDFVRSAWRLDLYGDDGDQAKTQAAQAGFSQAAAELVTLFRDGER